MKVYGTKVTVPEFQIIMITPEQEKTLSKMKGLTNFTQKFPNLSPSILYMQLLGSGDRQIFLYADGHLSYATEKCHRSITIAQAISILEKDNKLKNFI